MFLYVSVTALHVCMKTEQHKDSLNSLIQNFVEKNSLRKYVKASLGFPLKVFFNNLCHEHRFRLKEMR